MKICIVNPEYIKDGGGQEWSIRRIANFLADEGHTVHVVALSASRIRKIQNERLSTVVEYDTWRDDVKFFDISPFFSLSATDFAWHEVYKGLHQLAISENYDVFHAFNISYVGFVTTMVAHLVKRPVILSGRGSDINRNIFSLDSFSKIKWALESADWLTFVSHSMCQAADQIAHCKEKSTVIYNSTSLDFFEKAQTDINSEFRDNNSFLIGGAGILSRKKGIDIYTKAIEILADDKKSIKLLWIGDLEYSKKDCRYINEFESLKSSGFIQLTGIVEHKYMIEYLNLLDVFVLASIDEGCPNALIEAMLADRPIVATRVGAVPEIIQDKKEGLLVPPYNVYELIHAISTLRNDPEMRQSLGMAAGEKVRSSFNLDQEKNAWLNCYDTAMVNFNKNHR